MKTRTFLPNSTNTSDPLLIDDLVFMEGLLLFSQES
jgi:hypothetical protein